jgi:tRNA pseudouridine55 synthase
VSAPEGLLLIEKPGGLTSHDVIDRIRRALGTRKVGHAGTLDPMATGLLLVGVGRATRLLRYLAGLDKAYEGIGRLGEATDTQDAEGRVIATAPVEVDRADLERAMAHLRGDIDQVPPPFSAVKVGGQPLYRAARRGETPEAPGRRVHVDRFDLTGFDGRDFEFRVSCSSGTYVRSLVAQVGKSLDCGAHLTRLVRTSVGPFTLPEATSPENPGSPRPIEAAVSHLPALELNEAEAAAASNGRPLAPAGIEGPYAVLGPGRRLVAVYRDDGARAVPEMVLAPPPQED